MTFHHFPFSDRLMPGGSDTETTSGLRSTHTAAAGITTPAASQRNTLLGARIAAMPGSPCLAATDSLAATGRSAEQSSLTASASASACAACLYELPRARTAK